MIEQPAAAGRVRGRWLERAGRAGARLTEDRRLGAVLAVLVPALLAALLTGYELGERSIWLDEGASISIASQHGSALWHGIAHDGGNMLAYYLLLHLVIGAFGDAAAVIRLPSLLAQAATAGLVAALALQLFAGSRRIALTAGGLAAISLPLVFWGQDARGYAILVALVTGSFLALARVLEAPAGAPTPRAPLLAYAVTLLVALYVGFDAIFVIPAQLLVVGLDPRARRDRGRAVLGALLAVGVLCIPLLVLAEQRGASQLFWVPAPTGAVLAQALVALTSAGYEPNFHHSPVTTLTAVLTAALAIAALFRGLAPRHGPAPAPALPPWRVGGGQAAPTRLLAAWLVLPCVLALAASFAGEPIELGRTSILMIPALSLMLAWGLHRLPWPAGVRWGLLGTVLVLRVVVLAPSYGTSPENWKAAVRHVLAGTPARACVAFYPLDARMPFDYYMRAAGPAARASLIPVQPSAPWSTVAPYVERYVVPTAAELNTIVARCPTLWFVASHQGQPGGPPASRRDHRRYLELLAELKARYPQQAFQGFGYAAEVRVERLSR